MTTNAPIYHNVSLKDVLTVVANNDQCIIFGLNKTNDHDIIKIMATGILKGTESLIRINKAPDYQHRPAIYVYERGKDTVYAYPDKNAYSQAILDCATQDYNLDIIKPSHI